MQSMDRHGVAHVCGYNYTALGVSLNMALVLLHLRVVSKWELIKSCLNCNAENHDKSGEVHLTCSCSLVVLW